MTERMHWRCCLKLPGTEGVANNVKKGRPRERIYLVLHEEYKKNDTPREILSLSYKYIQFSR